MGFNDPSDVLFLQCNEGNSSVYCIFFIPLRNYFDIKSKDPTVIYIYTY